MQDHPHAQYRSGPKLRGQREAQHIHVTEAIVAPHLGSVRAGGGSEQRLAQDLGVAGRDAEGGLEAPRLVSSLRVPDVENIRLELCAQIRALPIW